MKYIWIPAVLILTVVMSFVAAGRAWYVAMQEGFELAGDILRTP